MRTPWISILLYIAASFLGAAGQLLYKSGADRAGGSAGSYLLNPRILAGAACYIGVMVLFVAALKRGGSLAVLYPVYATTFIWAALLSRYFYGTALRPIHAVGMALILAGMALMGKEV